MTTVDYRCGNCHKRYRRSEPAWSCCVQHGPHECCHFGETRITKKGKPKARHGDHRTVLRIGDPYPASTGTISTSWCAECGGWHPGTALCGNTTTPPWVLS